MNVKTEVKMYGENYPVGPLPRQEFARRVDEAYLIMKDSKLVSVGPRLSPAAVEAAEWFESEYGYLPMYLIVDTLIKVLYHQLEEVKAHEATTENMFKAVAYGQNKKQKVMKISEDSLLLLKEITPHFMKFNTSDVINLALITYRG